MKLYCTFLRLCLWFNEFTQAIASRSGNVRYQHKLRREWWALNNQLVELQVRYGLKGNV